MLRLRGKELLAIIAVTFPRGAELSDIFLSALRVALYDVTDN